MMKRLVVESEGFNSTNGEWLLFGKNWYGASPYNPILGIRFMFQLATLSLARSSFSGSSNRKLGAVALVWQHLGG